MIKLMMPNITATTPQEQMTQMRSYLYQLSGELQWALTTLEKNAVTVIDSTGNPVETVSGTAQEAQAQSSFNEIKSLIIKSADIVNAYYEEIDKKLNGEYFANSDFGTFIQKTENDIKANADAISANYTNVQTVLDEIGRQLSELSVNAYIRCGLLDTDADGDPIYGVEVGQQTTRDDVEVFNKYARFTAGKLSFYDNNEFEVSYISDYSMYITNAVIKGNLTVGEFVLDTSNGIAFRWIGG